MNLSKEMAIAGNGATACRCSDCNAYTIIYVSKNLYKITLQRDTVIELTKPIFITGGFAGYCTNQNSIEHKYEVNEEGFSINAFWSKKDKMYKSEGKTIIEGRHEFYDYNF